jgi:hypothetical protein
VLSAKLSLESCLELPPITGDEPRDLDPRHAIPIEQQAVHPLGGRTTYAAKVIPEQATPKTVGASDVQEFTGGSVAK